MFEKEILHISIKDRVTDNLKNTEIKLRYVFFSFSYLCFTVKTGKSQSKVNCETQSIPLPTAHIRFRLEKRDEFCENNHQLHISHDNTLCDFFCVCEKTIS